MDATSFPAKIHVDGFEADVQPTADGSLLMFRQLRVPRALTSVDAYGPGWFVGLARVRPGQVGFSHHKARVESPPALYLLIRDFSVVEWQLAAGELAVAFYITRRALPEDLARKFPRYACLIAPPSYQLPKAYDEAVEWLRRSDLCAPVDKCDKPESRALSVKEAIDGGFHDEDMSLMELYGRLGIPAACASREFKACYGISAVNYLNQIRASGSMWELIMSRRTTTEIAFDSGFNDYKRYFSQFKRYAHVAPSAFVRRRRD
jgi:AraC-like DNA-binding protein